MTHDKIICSGQLINPDNISHAEYKYNYVQSSFGAPGYTSLWILFRDGTRVEIDGWEGKKIAFQLGLVKKPD